MPPLHRTRSVLFFLRLTLFGLTSLAFALLAILPLRLAFALTRPLHTSVCCDTPQTFNLPYETLQLQTAAGMPVAAWYIPPPGASASAPGAVLVLAHGSGGNRTSMLPYAALLSRHGYGAVLLDLRAHGESGGSTYAIGWDSQAEVAAALDYLATRPEVDPQRLGGLGLSLGANVLLQAAAEDERLRAVVVEGAGARSFADAMRIRTNRRYAPLLWVLFHGVATFSGTPQPPSILEVVPRIAPRAIFLIYAQYGSGGEELTQQIFAAASQPKQLWYLPGGHHTAAISEHPGDYEARLIHFLDTYLNETP